MRHLTVKDGAGTSVQVKVPMVERIAKGKWYSNYLTSMVDPLVRKMSILHYGV